MDARQFTRWALGAWFVAVLAVAAAGGFVTSPNVPPLPIVAGVALPLAAFVTAYSRWGGFRSLVLSADLRLLTGIQAWRWAGLGFLSLYAYGVLPGLFALPAGLGDMAIGLTAPWMVARLASDPAFATSRRFAVWNALGILDLAVAVSLGGVASGIIPGLTSVLTTPMARLPLILIPAFLVPFFVMLHLTAIFQARRASAVRYSPVAA
jgi:hypothetical protein